MGSLVAFAAFVSDRLVEWRDTRLGELHFWHREVAWLALVTALACAALVWLARTLFRRRHRQTRVTLPALLTGLDSSRMAWVRHTPLLLMLAGIPCFILALADPYTSLSQKRMAFPGRRICLMIDASTSMVRWFDAPTLRQTTGRPAGTSDAAFFTTVAAAERFIRLRMDGKYRDLMALVEFGDQAYVVTPFTNDYDNILLSLSLIGDFGEFLRFPDQGTIISRAIEEGTRLFKNFNYLEASGNILLLFSDGEDAGVISQGTSVKQVVDGAIKAKIPVYFVRINHDKAMGQIIPDTVWKTAVEQTGGRFYAAASESTILQAIRDVDRASTGRIDVKQYVTQRPWFGPFALAAVTFWTIGLTLMLTVPYFRTFP